VLRRTVGGDDVRHELRARLTQWDGLLSREPAIARQILRKLLGEGG
jgi:hypothetical protein